MMQNNPMLYFWISTTTDSPLLFPLIMHSITVTGVFVGFFLEWGGAFKSKHFFFWQRKTKLPDHVHSKIIKIKVSYEHIK